MAGITRLSQSDFAEDDYATYEQNPNYICRITANDAAFTDSNRTQVASGPPTILLNLPEQFSFSVASAYEAPFSQGLIQNEGIRNFAKVMGVTNLVTQGLTAQVWQGTQEVQFTLTFELVAKNNPEEEIAQTIKKLMLLTVPGEGYLGLLTPPGPTIDFSATGSEVLQSLKTLVPGSQGSVQPPKLKYKNVITLEIGRFMRFPSVVIENVNLNGKSLFHRTGIPIAASIDVTFKTFLVPVKGDIDAMFPYTRQTRAAVK